MSEGPPKGRDAKSLFKFSCANFEGGKKGGFQWNLEIGERGGEEKMDWETMIGALVAMVREAE